MKQPISETIVAAIIRATPRKACKASITPACGLAIASGRLGMVPIETNFAVQLGDGNSDGVRVNIETKKASLVMRPTPFRVRLCAGDVTDSQRNPHDRESELVTPL